MLLSIIRTCLLYFVAFLAVKAMGKRGLAQLHPFELVVIFMISEMASVAMQNHGVPILNSVVPIATLAVLEIGISIFCLKSGRFRKIVSGSPSIIVSNGIIQQKEMAKLRMTIDDLEEEMRCQGYFDLAEIQYAIMETNGQFNIMPKALNRPVQTKDLQLQVPEDAPATLIIEDGVLNQEGLRKSGYNQAWLQKQLKKNRIGHVGQVFVASVDSDGAFFFQMKDGTSGKSEEG